jgi:hypothetical protein
MFQNAYSIASEFTFPVVISRKTLGGECYASIGTFIIINEEGWVATADHIVDGLVKMEQDVLKVDDWKQQIMDITQDNSIAEPLKRKKLKKIRRPPKDTTDKCSVWWANNDLKLSEYRRFPAADIAVCKIQGFDPSLVKNYPVFKNPKDAFIPGASL